jgi:hypothetical protein
VRLINPLLQKLKKSKKKATFRLATRLSLILIFFSTRDLNTETDPKISLLTERLLTGSEGTTINVMILNHQTLLT